MARDLPSELECVVLGVVWKFGPCTPHAIRTHFTAGGRTRFSASAGAIYPLVTRLERRRWLRSRREARGRQARRVYAITAAGIARLKTWLAPPFTAAEVSSLHDPLRIRVYFLGALAAADRRRFLDVAVADLRGTLARMRREARDYEEAGVPFSGAALRGAVELTRAQIRWLESLRSEIGAPRPRRARPGATR